MRSYETRRHHQSFSINKQLDKDRNRQRDVNFEHPEKLLLEAIKRTNIEPEIKLVDPDEHFDQFLMDMDFDGEDNGVGMFFD